MSLRNLTTQFKQKITAGIQALVAIALTLVLTLLHPIAAQAQTKPTLLVPGTGGGAPQPMSESDRAKLKDPFFQLVLKDHADAKTLPEIKQFLKPASQQVFVVDEHIVDSAPKVGNSLADRRSIITMSGTTNKQTLDQNVMFSVGFNAEQFPTANFIEVMGWDDSSGIFNYYKFDKASSESSGSWKFRGNSADVDTLSTSARQGTCMQCHINGGPLMKELDLPWNNWHSLSDIVPYLSQGNSSWPIVKAANSPLKDLEGAETLETATIMPSTTRFNDRRLERLKSPDGKSILDARRLLKPLFVTTEYNLVSSRDLSSLHPFSNPARSSGSAIGVPNSFFLNSKLLDNLNINADLSDVAFFNRKDYEHLLRQTKTTLNGQQPGDTNFAWLVPEAGFVDNDWVRQLMDQDIVPRAFVAAALAVDLENPVLSSDRAKLWSEKILPAQFKIGATNDLIPQVVKNLEALNPAAGTPEATFLQMLRKPEAAVPTLKKQVDQYITRERNLLGDKAKPDDRSREWIRLYKLALQRRDAVLADANLKSLDETAGKLLLARGDRNATVAALPSSLVVAVKTPPTVRLGDNGDTVITLQKRLLALGLFNGSVDGDFGPRTQAAVIAAQRKFQLTADGIVGGATWAALQGTIS
jgi:hypothetical protein